MVHVAMYLVCYKPDDRRFSTTAIARGLGYSLATCIRPPTGKDCQAASMCKTAVSDQLIALAHSVKN